MRIYSHSQLSVFETCQLKYKFQYLDNLDKAEKGVEAFVGSRVHETLEKLYRDLKLEKLNTLDELLSFYRAEWQKNWNAEVKILTPGLTEANYRAYGEQCIRNYYERFKPFDQSRTLDTEREVSFSLDPAGRYKMRGFIDRITRRADGTHEIHDYKTGGRLPSQEQIDSDRQLGLYEIALRSYWPEVERVELLWHYVGHDSTLRSSRSPAQLEALRQQTTALIDRVENEKNFDPRKGGWCEWCEFRAVCPLWKHVAAVEGLPPERFAEDAGVRLANEYAQTRSEIDRLQERLAELREKILAFAVQTQSRVLQGHGVRVSVTMKDLFKFPDKKHPARAELEEFLHKVAKWDEVSDLNANRLRRILEGAEWPPELLDELRRFATSTPWTTLRVSGSLPAKEDGE